MMKRIQVAAAVALALSSVSFAQQAVQWRLEDGGNGHWYQMKLPGPITWPSAKIDAERLGGHLATPTTEAEKGFVTSLILAVPGFGESATYRWGPWLGGFQDRSAPTYTEPSEAWRWVTGEQWGYSAWRMDEPNNLCSQTQEQEDFLAISGNGVQSNGAWNDLPPNGCGNDPVVSYIIEWSADCNNDGVVDYGQCRDGSLTDYNGNNIPDCCESGTACVVGNYPVQWRVADGGNAHWYQARRVPGIRWPDAKSSALSSGGHLAAISSPSEDSFLKTLAINSVYWIGGARVSGADCSAASGWSWVTDEPFGYAGWAQSQPDCWAQGQLFLAVNNIAYFPGWHDYDDGQMQCFVIEWDADCNSDGIVDYGQILTGQLADSDSNGAPDVCEAVTCRDADFFPDRNVNGADLGLLLSQWGEVNQYTVTDLNRDGIVDGADLGIVLSFWGPCPY